MSVQAVSWLPRQALADGVIEEKLSQIAQAWSGHWFAPQKCLSIESNEINGPLPPPPVPELVWVTEDGGACVHASAFGEEGVARAMLGLAAAKGKTRTPDRAMFAQLAKPAIQDFAARVGSLSPQGHVLELSGKAPGIDQGLRFEIRDAAGAPFIHVRFRQDYAVILRRALSIVQPRTVRLGAMAEAVAPLPITLGARIGSAEISLKEFEGMAPGDVLVLDSAIEERVELTINGVPVFPKLIMLEPVPDGLAIRFKERPNV